MNGLDAEGSSSVIVNGTYQSNNNGVFRVNINGSSSFTLSQSQVSVSGNTLGIQMGTGASAFVADAATSITASNNVTTGLTIVSGAHMVDSAEQSRPAATASTAFLLTQKPGSTSVPSGR